MDLQEQQKEPPTSLCFTCQSINDENNNLTNSTCSNCQSQNRLEEKKNERMIIVPDTSSGDEYWCSSCSSINDSELISLDTRKLWHDIAHIIKCVYRETNREFTENHSSNDICKAKEHVQILTQINAESLFNKVESIVLVYVNEIRNQVLKRFQTCLKTSNDVQLFISFLLDEYNAFIQAAKNVSTIVSYLEEHYMKSFHLTWLLYNKHLYEKLVYMDKKIQHSMSTMIDLLQPSNDDENNYSPAEYTQLLNRFLAFDEEMSEIACLYKDCQSKMTAITSRNRNQMGMIVKSKKKKFCKKTTTIKNIPENLIGSTTTAVNIPLSNNSSSVPLVPQQGSNGSSIGSGICGKESSSISSFDDYLLGNNTSSSSYTKEEPDGLIHDDKDLHEQLFHGILNNVSPLAQVQLEIDELKLNENTKTADNEEKQKPITKEITINDKPQPSNETSSKKSKSSKSSSNRRKESFTTAPNNSSSLPKKSLTPDLIFPPKPPSSSTASKFQADFRPLAIPLLTKNESPSCQPFLSTKIQSVSFTAGTFGSITTNESSHSSNNQSRLSINLTRKSGSFCPSAYNNNLDQLLRQVTSSKEKSTDEMTCLHDKNCDFCCCDLFHDPNSSSTNGPIHDCVTCMSLPPSATITCGYNPRDIERKERLQLKLTRRAEQNLHDQETTPIGNKSKTKHVDNNIDELVRFIDGTETTTTKESTAKKNKKKKEKQLKNKSNNPEQTTSSSPIHPVVENPQPLSKRQQKAKLKLEQNQLEEPSTTIPPAPPAPPKETTPPIQTNVYSPSESSIPPEEEVNWITISRKQSKHKPPPPPVPSLLAAPIPPKNAKQKIVNSKKTTISNTSTLAQQKVISPTVNSDAINKQQQNTVGTPSHVHNHGSQKANYTNQVVPSSILSVPSKTPPVIPNAIPLEEPPSSIYWDQNGYLLPPSSQSTIIPSTTPGPVQRPMPSFSPAPGAMNTTTSRCIQRPSSEPRTDSFPLYSPMNYTVGSSISSWNDPPLSQWEYPQTSNDFPLYDPFNSGTGLTMPPSTLLTNGFEENYGDRHIPQNHDIDEMNTLDKDIEDFKKFYFGNGPLEAREQVQDNINRSKN